MVILLVYYTTIILYYHLLYYDIAKYTYHAILSTLYMREDHGGMNRHSLHALL